MTAKKLVAKGGVKKATLSTNSNDKNKQYEINARDSISASIMSAAVAEPFNKVMFPDVEVYDYSIALDGKIKAAQDGDMSAIEAMLVGQAQALQTIFVSLGRKAANMTQLKQYTAFMGMALKAQSQSRATIQALTELKYPKQATFVKQANISHGHQQVNNHDNTDSPARVEKIANQSNELLEVNNGSQTMDIRATQTAGNEDKAMATVVK